MRNSVRQVAPQTQELGIANLPQPSRFRQLGCPNLSEWPTKITRARRTVKTRMTIFALITFGLAVLLSKAEPNGRFDGIWFGTETLVPARPVRPHELKDIPPPHDVTFAVSQGGALVGKSGGPCMGRYSRVTRSGDTLSFGAGSCNLKLSLSADGKTLIEQGNCQYPTRWIVRFPTGRTTTAAYLPLQLTGTFHQAK
jgi:hypothetical protein